MDSFMETFHPTTVPNGQSVRYHENHYPSHVKWLMANQRRFYWIVKVYLPDWVVFRFACQSELLLLLLLLLVQDDNNDMDPLGVSAWHRNWYGGGGWSVYLVRGVCAIDTLWSGFDGRATCQSIWWWPVMMIKILKRPPELTECVTLNTTVAIKIVGTGNDAAFPFTRYSIHSLCGLGSQSIA